MKFLKPLGDTKLPPLALLDLAYVIVLLPLLLILKVPMLAFVIMVTGIIFFKKESASNRLILFVFIVGLFAIYLSMYGAFSFRGLSRLKLFIELMVYLLLVVVSMQRLSRTINFYLLISPMLFLALSLFFFTTLPMLVYVVFEVFFLLWMILAHRMEGDLIESFRSSMVMFMYSLPWVVVLFIFFPRISFEHATYGFKAEQQKRMGHDGTMYLDNKALDVPSERIVMEVGFEGQMPPSDLLYFRGSMLYVDKTDHWEPMPPNTERKNRPKLATKQQKTEYKVTLYPTQKRWLYLLDMPYTNVENATLDSDLISLAKKPVTEPIHYAASSILTDSLEDTLDTVTRETSLDYDATQNPKTYKEAQKLKKLYASDRQRAKALYAFFKAQSLTYTLKPKPLDINHTTDSFLFDTHSGYCVHFASSFVTMARMAGIPARIVTGYKADLSNTLKNYLAVKEKDAHAWAEIYIEGAWRRVETTSTATHIEAQTQAELKQSQGSPLYRKINLYLMYAKYQVETWILYYSNLRQLQLLAYAKENPLLIVYFLLGLLALISATMWVILYFRRPLYENQALVALQPVLKKLEKQGFIRGDKETLHQYFLRLIHANQESKKLSELLHNIDTLYQELTYANENSHSQQTALKRLVKDFKSVNLPRV